MLTIGRGRRRAPGVDSEVMIPAAVADVDLPKYREIRDSYGEIRESFKRLTSEASAMLHRLARIGDATESVARVESVAASSSGSIKNTETGSLPGHSRHGRRCASAARSTVAGSLVEPILGYSEWQLRRSASKSSKNGSKSPRLSTSVCSHAPGLRRDIVASSGIENWCDRDRGR